MIRHIGRPATWISLAIYLLFIIAKLAVHDGDITRFIVAGDRFFTKSELTYPIAVEPHSDGYDGQFYYRLALDPLTTKRTAFGITMEQNPVVRDQRILYPATVWLVSGGNGYVVPFMMVAVNLLSLLLIAWFGLRLADHFGVDSRLAILFPLYPGFILSLSRDTVEIFATLFALSAILAAVRKNYIAASLLAGAAVLARETTLLYMAGFGLVALYESVVWKKSYVRVLLCAVPLIIFLIWEIVLRSIWGSLPVQDLGPHDLSMMPFVEYGRWMAIHWAEAMEPRIRYSHLYTLAAFVLIPVFLVFIIYAIATRRSVNVGIVISWTLYAVMTTFFTGAIWIEAYGFLRILCDLYILGVAALVSGRNEAALRRMMPVVAVTWFATAIYAL